MVRRVVCALAVCALFSAGAVVAEEAKGPPKPGPEHEKLGFFVGKWTMEGTMGENPFFPAGKVTGKEECKWFEGKFGVVCHSEGTGPMGPMKGLGILSYAAEEKAYTYYGIDSSGMTMTTVPKGTIDGDTWTYTDESMMGGQKVKSRYTLKQLSATSYSFQWQVHTPEGTWATVMEGKSTKAK